MAIRASSRASAAPRQKWMPYPKVRWCPIVRLMSNASPSGGNRRSSRLADAMRSIMALPSGTVSPWSSTSRVT